MKRITVGLVALLTLICAPLAGAHHSYANFNSEERYVFSGTLTDVQWSNPHILLFVSDGTRTMRVEWLTINGADTTGVAREQFKVGAQIAVTGSRHRDPAVPTMSLVKAVDVPATEVHWATPTRANQPAWIQGN